MIKTVPNHGTYEMVPIERIQIETQIRTRNGFDEESLAGLAETIREHGILQPLLIRAADENGMHRLVAGERRILAASMAGLTEVPAVITQADDRDAAAMQAIENLQREDLALADVVEGLASLYAQHKSWREVARKIGKSPAWVSKRRAMTRLHPIAQALMNQGITTDPEVLLTMNNIERKDAAKAAKLAKQLEAGTVSRDAVRKAWEAMQTTDKKDGQNSGAEGERDGGSDGGDDTPGDDEDQKPKALTLRLDDASLGYLRHTIREMGEHGPIRDRLLAHLDAMFKAL